jgi:diguanylate cyclase (GGDEF)-like protein/PAS domain S-box-containing protein
LRAEIVRLKKIVQALINRAERNTSVRGSDFSAFQAAVMLEEQVRVRTVTLEATLRENEKISRALSESEAKFHGLVNQSLVGITLIEDGKYTYTNAKFREIFGYNDDEIPNLGLLDMVIESDRPRVAEIVRQRLCGDVERAEHVYRGLRKNGEVIDVEVHSSVMEIGGRRALISLFMDVTERARAEQEVRALRDRLREQSIRDVLTGLYNRRYLEETLGRELILAAREERPVSVIMADLDHFKKVNDLYGHLAGDEVLRVFGELLKRHSRASDIYCRYGGEEFLLVLPGLPKEIAVKRAELLRSETAAAPVNYGASPIGVTASFGVATFPDDGRSSDELIGAADRALYAAKAAGRNRVALS